jgi:hypothetical protein
VYYSTFRPLLLVKTGVDPSGLADVDLRAECGGYLR